MNLDGALIHDGKGCRGPSQYQNAICIYSPVQNHNNNINHNKNAGKIIGLEGINCGICEGEGLRDCGIVGLWEAGICYLKHTTLSWIHGFMGIIPSKRYDMTSR